MLMRAGATRTVALANLPVDHHGTWCTEILSSPEDLSVIMQLCSCSHLSHSWGLCIYLLQHIYSYNEESK